MHKVSPPHPWIPDYGSTILLVDPTVGWICECKILAYEESTAYLLKWTCTVQICVVHGSTVLWPSLEMNWAATSYHDTATGVGLVMQDWQYREDFMIWSENNQITHKQNDKLHGALKEKDRELWQYIWERGGGREDVALWGRDGRGVSGKYCLTWDIKD